jgi:hypothetical protein
MTLRLPPSGNVAVGGAHAAEVVILGQSADDAPLKQISATVAAPGKGQRLAGPGDGDDGRSTRHIPAQVGVLPVRVGGVPVVHGSQAGLGVTAAGSSHSELDGGPAGPLADLRAGADPVQEDEGPHPVTAAAHGRRIALGAPAADVLSGGVVTHEGAPIPVRTGGRG